MYEMYSFKLGTKIILIILHNLYYIDSKHLNMTIHLNPCVSLPLNMDENDFEVLIQKTKDWTLMHGNYIID